MNQNNPHFNEWSNSNNKLIEGELLTNKSATEALGCVVEAGKQITNGKLAYVISGSSPGLNQTGYNVIRPIESSDDVTLEKRLVIIIHKPGYNQYTIYSQGNTTLDTQYPNALFLNGKFVANVKITGAFIDGDAICISDDGQTFKVYNSIDDAGKIKLGHVTANKQSSTEPNEIRAVEFNIPTKF